MIQAMPVSRELRRRHREVLVHTGQHADYRLSQAFFDEPGIPFPDYNLEVGPGSHGYQTAKMLVEMEALMQAERPDLVIVRGGTAAALAGALTASKLNIPCAHIEAGERSRNRQAPDEINRLITDRLANQHFCASRQAVANLAGEGISDSVYWVGDVLLDALLQTRLLARRRSAILPQLELESGGYAFVSLTHPANTGDPLRLAQIVEALNGLREKIILPLQPRMAKALAQIDARFDGHVAAIHSLGYYDLLVLEENARLIAADSGRVQREAYFFGIPCLTLRDETEWVDTLATGWNRLVKAEAAQIQEAWLDFSPPAEHPQIFGNGSAAQQIVQILEQEMPVRRIREMVWSTPGYLSQSSQFKLR